MSENQALVEMPKYQCHKVVHALKIDVIIIDETNGIAKITPKESNFAEFQAPDGWLERYKGSEEDTGYYVVYKDGYISWSPTKEFEEGYSRI